MNAGGHGRSRPGNGGPHAPGGGQAIGGGATNTGGTAGPARISGTAQQTSHEARRAATAAAL